VGSQQVPRDPLSNSGLTEELDEPIGAAAAYAVRNVPVARPEERVGWGVRCWTGCGSTFDSAIVVAVCTNGRLVGLAAIELLLAAPADAVLADVMDIDPPVVAPDTHQERAAWLASKRTEPGVAVVDEYGFPGPNPPHRLAGILLREHDEDLARRPSGLHCSRPNRQPGNSGPTLVAPDAVGGRRLGRRDGLGRPAGWHRGPDGYQPRGGLLHPRNRVPGRCGRHPDRDLAIRGFIRGRRDRPASPGARRAHRTARRLPFSRPQYCPSSAGNGTIPHDVDVNTQIEAAVGGQGSSSRP
jgi:hypothetical protein